jgi:hypothetical protein
MSKNELFLAFKCPNSTLNLRPLKTLYKRIRELAMAFHVYLTYMDIVNIIVMSGTSLTIYSKAFRHPAYQMLG